MTLAAFFDIHTIAFTLLGYPLSYLELFGTIFNLASVVLVARKRIENWPVGLVGVVLFLVLFYQIRLYADFFEQIYYLVTSFYGWYLWARGQAKGKGQAAFSFSSGRVQVLSAGLTLLLSCGAAWLIARLDLFWPALFPAPASYPFLDALTTLMSFTATILMAQRRTECWVYWILVDVIGVGLYFAKGVVFISALYLVFLFLAIAGLRTWRREGQL
jgi:nicotinamide mononucleotide transporter